MEDNEIIGSDVDIFTSLPYINDKARVETTTFYPTQFSENTGTIAFQIPSSTNHFTSPYFTLRTNWKIVQGDGKPTIITDKVAAINFGKKIKILIKFVTSLVSFAAHFAMFNDVTVRLGDKIIANYNQLWANYVYYYYTFNWSSDAKSTWFQYALHYSQDAPGFFANFGKLPKEGVAIEEDDDDNKKPKEKRSDFLNPGLYDRWRMSIESITQRTEAVLPFEFAQSGRVLPNKLPITIEFRHALDSQRLLASDPTANFKLVVESVELKVQRITPTPNILRGIEYRMEQGNALWQLNYKSYNILGPTFIPRGTSLIRQQLTNKTRPIYLLISFIKASSVAGNFAESPQVLEHLNVKYARATFENQQEPINGYQIDFDGGTGENKNIIELFNQFMKVCGYFNENRGSGIDLLKFAYNYTLFAFSFAENSPSEQYKQPQFTGNTSVEFQLSKETTNTHCMFATVLTQTQLSIDKTRTVQITED